MPDRNLDKIEGRLAFAAEFLRRQREYQKRLALALDIAGVGMWDWEVETDTLTWDKRMCELFGAMVCKGKPCEVPGDRECSKRTYEDFITKIVPDDRERVQQAIDAALAGETYDITYRINPGGDVCCRVIHARGMLHKNGGPAKLIGVCLEIEGALDC